MKCVICRSGETDLGKTTVIFERDETILVVKDVPAKVCNNCGEEYVDDSVGKKLLKQAEDTANAGVQVDIRKFVA